LLIYDTAVGYFQALTHCYHVIFHRNSKAERQAARPYQYLVVVVRNYAIEFWRFRNAEFKPQPFLIYLAVYAYQLQPLLLRQLRRGYTLR
jgi:hypothetical protein